MIQTPEEVEKEMTLVKEFILLPLLMTTVDNMRQNQMIDDATLKPIIEGSHEALINLIHADLVKVRQEMREKKIKVWEAEPARPYLNYRYISRGYEERFMLIKTVAKAELSVKLGKYVERLIRSLK